MADWKPAERFAEWPGCLGCMHYQRMRCIAYPTGIPLIVAGGAANHFVPRPGQVGEAVFESLDLHWWIKTRERRVLAEEPEPADAAEEIASATPPQPADRSSAARPPGAA